MSKSWKVFLFILFLKYLRLCENSKCCYKLSNSLWLQRETWKYEARSWAPKPLIERAVIWFCFIIFNTIIWQWVLWLMILKSGDLPQYEVSEANVCRVKSVSWSDPFCHIFLPACLRQIEKYKKKSNEKPSQISALWSQIRLVGHLLGSWLWKQNPSSRSLM